MNKKLIFSLAAASLATISSTQMDARVQKAAESHFTFKDSLGNPITVGVVPQAETKKLSPSAVAKINPTLTRAATIAQDRANAHSRRMCWAYVKNALLASGAVSSRPTTPDAKDAAQELVTKYGFRKLPVRDPYQAPVGSVLVYNAKGAPGHVEIRTQDGFVSDFRSKTPSPRPLIGIFAKS